MTIASTPHPSSHAPPVSVEAGRAHKKRIALLSAESRAAARAAWQQLAWVVPCVVGLLILSHNRSAWMTGLETEVRALSAVLLTALGAMVARDVGRVLAPTLLGRLGPETAATVGFAIRLIGIVVIVLLALRAAGLPPRTLAVGGAAAAIVLGLAAQQTIGNVFAGFVLISARPFRVGERVRFQAGVLAGQVTATVRGLGLLYVECSDGPNRVLIPNSAAIQCAVTPLYDIDAVDFEARLRSGTRPSDVQSLLDHHVTVATASRPHIELRGLDDDEVVVRIRATPADQDEGWLLADQVIAAVNDVTKEALTTEHAVVRAHDDRVDGQSGDR